MKRYKILIFIDIFLILCYLTYLILTISAKHDNVAEITTTQSTPVSIKLIIDEPITQHQNKEIDSSDEVEVIPEPETQRWSDDEVELLSKMLWGEARGVSSDTEKAAVIWCVLNRVDAGYGDIDEVVTAPNQFVGYSQNNQSTSEMITLCIDVLTRWYAEKDGQTDVGRVLPQEYLYFSGDGVRNHFRNAYTGGTVWDWSLPSPYEN